MAVSILGLGTIVVDHLVVLPGYPDADTKTVVLRDAVQVGGPVPTAMVLLRRFGWRCGFVGTWADDAYGRLIEADLEREAVQFDRESCRRARRSGFSHVWVDGKTGSRTIACSRPEEGVPLTDVDRARLAEADALHLDGWPTDTALDAARWVREHGGTVFLDTGSLKPGFDALLQHVDVVSAPQRLLAQRFGDDDPQAGIKRLLKMGPRLVAVTRGGAGAWLGTSAGVIAEPAVTVEAVDTTGAGDVFCGALIHGVLSRWPERRILQFACAAAGAKCRALGNRDALPVLADLPG